MIYETRGTTQNYFRKTMPDDSNSDTAVLSGGNERTQLSFRLIHTRACDTHTYARTVITGFIRISNYFFLSFS